MRQPSAINLNEISRAKLKLYSMAKTSFSENFQSPLTLIEGANLDIESKTTRVGMCIVGVLGSQLEGEKTIKKVNYGSFNL